MRAALRGKSASRPFFAHAASQISLSDAAYKQLKVRRKEAEKLPNYEKVDCVNVSLGPLKAALELLRRAGLPPELPPPQLSRKERRRGQRAKRKAALERARRGDRNASKVHLFHMVHFFSGGVDGDRMGLLSQLAAS